ncbi:MAG: YbaB/EbfC family nucleoid-associated protein [Candidatus Neomarinimicrobiota bacterium]|nr:YbaB/EbfC family nucleoid-associated protein [Candidatus Neomarinimicrobiota bacterium]MEE3152984.1 YbaB/EbfC family nucleoid-associated protein [Candidatus Neomarinimicrobiota bacterium]
MMFKGNMAKMLKQAQDMQKRIESVQAELSDTVIDVDSGGGMVRIKINGKLELLELNIDSEVLKEDKEIIEDLIIAAVNKGISKAQSDSQDKMNSVTGGMLSGLNIPGI